MKEDKKTQDFINWLDKMQSEIREIQGKIKSVQGLQEAKCLFENLVFQSSLLAISGSAGSHEKDIANDFKNIEFPARWAQCNSHEREVLLGWLSQAHLFYDSYLRPGKKLAPYKVGNFFRIIDCVVGFCPLSVKVNSQ